MKGSDFEALIRSGQRPVVTFLKGVGDQDDGYLELGMRGRLLAAREEDDDFVVFAIDLTEFEPYNEAFESANYYDKAKNPCLTAKQAGMYKPQETLWSRKLEEAPMEVVTSGQFQLYQRFQEAGAATTYVQWLEERVLALESDFVPQGG